MNFLSWELHAGGLTEHLGQNKTIEVIENKFYWWTLKRDVAKIVGQYRTCQLASNKNILLVLTLSFLYPFAIGKTWAYILY